MLLLRLCFLDFALRCRAAICVQVYWRGIELPYSAVILCANSTTSILRDARLCMHPKPNVQLPYMSNSNCLSLIAVANPGCCTQLELHSRFQCYGFSQPSVAGNWYSIVTLLGVQRARVGSCASMCVIFLLVMNVLNGV